MISQQFPAEINNGWGEKNNNNSKKKQITLLFRFSTSLVEKSHQSK